MKFDRAECQIICNIETLKLKWKFKSYHLWVLIINVHIESVQILCDVDQIFIFDEIKQFLILGQNSDKFEILKNSKLGTKFSLKAVNLFIVCIYGLFFDSY